MPLSVAFAVPYLRSVVVLEQWDARRLAWAPVSPDLALPQDSVLLLRLRVSRGPLHSDTVSGLVSELFGSAYSPRNGQHGLP